MKTSLVITTINKPNKNIQKLCNGSKKNKWNFIIIGDKKSPKKFPLRYGHFYGVNEQKKIKLKFPKICKFNNYARKNIGYLLAFRQGSELIVETDDDNCPKENFFNKKTLSHKVNEIKNKSWINIYDFFLKKKNFIWPRGLPLDEINSTKILTSKKKFKKKFYLQQGVCEKNPDVDAIYRLINKNINIKFKNNLKISTGNSLNIFNSQNTLWFKKIFPLMYLPVTCSMRCTDIWRSLVALKILKNDRKKILFFGTTMFQDRNFHDLNKDFEQEVPMYVSNKKMFNILNDVRFSKGEKNYLKNLLKAYKILIKYNFISKNELKFLNAWISDIEHIKKTNAVKLV